MTKAGKVRMQTPKIVSTGVNSHKKAIPKKRYKKLYEKRIVENKFGGQSDSIAAKKYGFQKS